jgi:DNA-directed RNA polymerase specialized sigma24 family protein
MKRSPSRSGKVLHGLFQESNQKRKPPIKTKQARFDTLVARYYPSVYSFASRLADDPREAIALTRNAFRSSQKQLCNLRDQTAVATTLILAVIRAGLAGR